MKNILPHNWNDEKPSFIGIVLIVLGLLLLSSCITESKCRSQFPCVQKDSITVQIVEKIKEVTIKDTARIRYWLPSPCDTGKVKPGFQMVVETDKGGTAILKEHKGGLQVSTGINGMNARASVKDTCISKYVTLPPKYIELPLKWWQTALQWMGVVLLVIVAWQVLKRLPV